MGKPILLQAYRRSWWAPVCVGMFALGCNAADGGRLKGAFTEVQPVQGELPGDAGMDGGSTDPTKPPPVVSDPAPREEGCHLGRCFWSSGTDECSSAGVPTLAMAPPAPSPDAGADLPPIYLGWSKLWLGETPVPDAKGNVVTSDEIEEIGFWSTFGFDLDGTCTNVPACSDLPEGEVGCQQGGVQVPFDGDGCRDNTFARYQPLVAQVPELGLVYGLTEDAMNCALYRGEYTHILRISGYNGKRNDPQVRLDSYASPGLEEQPFWSCPVEEVTEKYAPWLASEPWLVSEADLDGPVSEPGTLPNSKNFATMAFVRDGYLVAFPEADLDFRLPGDNSVYPGWSMKAQHSVLTGKLVKESDGTWKLESGLVAGRVEEDDLLGAFRQVGVCPSAGLGTVYDSVSQYVRDGLDVLAGGGRDPEAECDAMSLAIAFEAKAITPGEVVPTDERVDCCLEENEGKPSCKVGCGDGRVTGTERCDTGIDEGGEGACPTSCEPVDACHPRMPMGEGCDVECVPVTITAFQDDDGCCPDGGNATNDNDCPGECGNGVREGDETCDPQDTCPTAETCTSGDVCVLAILEGDPDTCTSACTVAPVDTCEDDGCCAPGCDHENDPDCPNPSDCGNGEQDQGETCDGDCATSCDDGDVCTADMLVGSAATCDARCAAPRITECGATEGCCPAGCNANNDPDCAEACGNGVQEGDEECDDGNLDPLDGCYACKVETDQDKCTYLIEQDGTTSPECMACQCEKCATPFLSCANGFPDSEDNLLCSEVVRCGRDSGCSDLVCFCGDSWGCGFLIPGSEEANGPCASQIKAAAKSNLTTDVIARQTDLSFPVGRAAAVGTCAQENCAAECLSGGM